MVDFKINQDFIAKVLCINKETPELQCNGKCQLAKELKKVDTPTERNAPAQKIEELKLEYFAPKTKNLYQSRRIKLVTSKNIFFKEQLKISLFSEAIFHPPKTSFILLG